MLARADELVPNDPWLKLNWGAYYAADTDFTSWFGKQFSASIEDCQAATNTRDVVYAYPSMN